MPPGLIAVVDTDVWSRLYLSGRTTDPRAPRWRERLVGATVVIATQTRAEVLAGLAISNWGERRLHDARSQLDRTATIPVDDTVVSAYAALTAECRQHGHPLHQNLHAADRWVAATARAWNLPLLAGDGVYRGAPGIRLLDES